MCVCVEKRAHRGHRQVNQSRQYDRTVGQASLWLISARGHYHTANTGSVITDAPATSHRMLSKCQKANWARGRAALWNARGVCLFNFLNHLIQISFWGGNCLVPADLIQFRFQGIQTIQIDQFLRLIPFHTLFIHLCLVFICIFRLVCDKQSSNCFNYQFLLCILFFFYWEQNVTVSQKELLHEK